MGVCSCNFEEYHLCSGVSHLVNNVGYVLAVKYCCCCCGQLNTVMYRRWYPSEFGNAPTKVRKHRYESLAHLHRILFHTNNYF